MTTKRCMILIKWPVFFLMPLFMSGCDMLLLQPTGIVASQQKQIFLFSSAIMLVVVIPVIILTLLFSWRYRASNTHAKYTPNWDHNYLLEFIWWTIPCIIVIALAVITWITSYQLDPYRPISHKNKAITIQVVSLNWKWLFIYPEHNIAVVNYLQFPKNVPIHFKITADAPMNSFWLPQLGSQIMSMPGMQTQLYTLANETGNYMGVASNFSGSRLFFNEFYCACFFRKKIFICGYTAQNNMQKN